MKKIFKVIGYILLCFVGILILGVIIFNVRYAMLNSKAKKQLSETYTLMENGYRYRDLNKNGKLDVYEDSRAEINDRIEDLLSQMTIEEKAGMMWHPPIGVGSKGELLGKPSYSSMSMNSTFDVILNKKITHFNLFTVPDAKHLAEWSNRLQKLAEQSRLGIPVSISSDPRHGLSNFIGSDLLGGDWSRWPEPIGLAATNDSLMVAEFGRIANAEYRAVGIRTALHPMADLATEPRWARINGTFGEDADLSAKITAAYIYGFQGDSLDSESVACMVKHWPGGGPQENGEDAHFRYGMNQAYPGNNFDYHLIPFEAAFKANVAMLMPYYGVPSKQTSEEVGMGFNKEIISDLLRKEYKYDGIVCSDWGILEGFSFLGIEIVEPKNWGVEDLTVKERIKKGIDAGIDQYGGNDNTDELVELIKEGAIKESRIDESVRRLLKAKFVLGLFDNPYVNVDYAVEITHKKEHLDKGALAQRKSIVLLKNTMNPDSSFILPLKPGIKIYVENIGKEVASKFGAVVENIEEADFAVLRLSTPYEERNGDLIERLFHQGSLDFQEPELGRILEIAMTKPTVVCMYMERPAVIPDITTNCAGLLCEFGASDDAVLDVIFGNFNPQGKLPFEVPSSMKAVENQKEDVPYDSENPLFEFGHGLSY